MSIARAHVSPPMDVDSTTSLRVIDTDASTSANSPAAVAIPGVGDLVGRFILLKRIGSGAMGTVYSALDPDLQRTVAIKFIYPELNQPVTSVDERSKIQLDLLAEGQALARVSHPNVVSVYDVGVLHDFVYVAMELVAGRSLRAWLDQKDRSIDEILAVMLRIGEGLSAMHLAGLIHRDIKPENIVVGDDGVPKIVDFGLAWNARQDHRVSRNPSRRQSFSSSPPRTSSSGQSHTHTGHIVGTPAYMPPEQFFGEHSGPASDQFSFCVTLYEAIFHERPWRRRTPTSIEALGAPRAIRKPLRLGLVRRRIFRILSRGLSAYAVDRFPSLDELLDELRDRPIRRRLRLASFTTLLLAIAGLFLLTMFESDAVEKACRLQAQRGESLWTAARRARIRDNFQSSHIPSAGSLFENVDRKLLTFIDEWQSSYQMACTFAQAQAHDSTWATHQQPCFEKSLRGAEVFIQLLLKGDKSTIQYALDGAMSLTTPKSCRITNQSDEVPKIPEQPELIAPVEMIRRDLQRVGTLTSVGDTKSAYELASQIHSRALKIPFPPLHVESLQSMLQLESSVAMSAQTTERLWDGFELSVSQKMDSHAFYFANELLFTNGYIEQNRDSLQELLRRSESLATRSKQNQREYARFLHAAAAAVGINGDHILAEQIAAKSVAYHEQLLGHMHHSTAMAIHNLAVARSYRGDLERTVEGLLESQRIDTILRGQDRPDDLLRMSNISNIALRLGKLSIAEEYAQRAVAIAEKYALEPGDYVFRAYRAQALLQREKCNYVEALHAAERRLELVRAFRRDAYSERAEALASVAILQLELERDDDAAAATRQTLGLLARAEDIGKSRFEDLMTAMLIAEAALRLDHLDLAEQAIERVRAFATIPRYGEEPMLKQLFALEAIYFEKKGNTEKSDAAWTQALQDSPVHIRQPRHRFLALEYVKYLVAREQYEKARNVLEQLDAELRERLGDTSRQRCEGLRAQAEVYEEQAQYHLASARIELALALCEPQYRTPRQHARLIATQFKIRRHAE